MVRPAAFGFNPETAETNAFQAPAESSATDVPQRALAEFDAFVAALRAGGVRVIVFQDPGQPPTPDSLFPNNWLSFHADGRTVFYPMQAPNRRAERRPAVLSRLTAATGCAPTEIIDFTAAESENRFLEGTGSLVLDRVARVAYACRSPRTDPALATAWANRLGYELVLFDAVDAAGKPIYHTNVLMTVGETVAVVCAEAFTDAATAGEVQRRLTTSERIVLPITRAQMSAFAGNMLQLRTASGSPLLVLSARAWRALTTKQQTQLVRQSAILTAALDTIESHGGGSARCMLCEVFGIINQQEI